MKNELRATAAEMERLLKCGNRDEMAAYLMSHCPQSDADKRQYQLLREREYMLRSISTEETEKTNKLLKVSVRNRAVG